MCVFTFISPFGEGMQSLHPSWTSRENLKSIINPCLTSTQLDNKVMTLFWFVCWELKMAAWLGEIDKINKRKAFFRAVTEVIWVFDNELDEFPPLRVFDFWWDVSNYFYVLIKTMGRVGEGGFPCTSAKNIHTKERQFCIQSYREKSEIRRKQTLRMYV